jgi:hypothetical protein
MTEILCTGRPSASCHTYPQRELSLSAHGASAQSRRRPSMAANSFRLRRASAPWLRPGSQRRRAGHGTAARPCRTVKDLIDVQGLPTTAGSNLLLTISPARMPRSCGAS